MSPSDKTPGFLLPALKVVVLDASHAVFTRSLGHKEVGREYGSKPLFYFPALLDKVLQLNGYSYWGEGRDHSFLK